VESRDGVSPSDRSIIPRTEEENAHGQVYRAGRSLDNLYVGCTLAVVGPSGKRLGSQVVETNAGALIEVLRGIPKQRHMCMGEGTLSEWLHEVLEPHIEELVVTGIGKKSRGPKSDKQDAFGRLGNLARAYGFLVGDTVRVKNRLRSVLRSRGVGYGAGRTVYSKRDREQWLAALPEATKALAAQLYEEHDALVALRERSEKTMLAEAKKHREWHVLRTCPGLGPIRVAELLPVVVTPYRFRSRSRFWAYCGLGIVMRSSSDWVRTQTGEWAKVQVQQTRGLNRNFNHTLKRIFKGAATTVIGRADDGPLYRHYESLLDGGTKPNLAKLTIARQIAATTLALWRTGERYNPTKLEATK
jgi:transposase